MRPIRYSFVNKERRRGREYTTRHFNSKGSSPSLTTCKASVEKVRSQFHPRGFADRFYLCSYTAERGSRYPGVFHETGYRCHRLPGGVPAGVNRLNQRICSKEQARPGSSRLQALLKLGLMCNGYTCALQRTRVQNTRRTLLTSLAWAKLYQRDQCHGYLFEIAYTYWLPTVHFTPRTF